MRYLPALVLAAVAICAPASAGVPAAKLSETEQLVLAKVQTERTRSNPSLSPFIADPQLMAVAHARSEDMAARNAFAHADAAGNNPYQIVAKAIPGFRGAIGENIMTDPLPSSGFEPAATAARVVAAWMASAQHAANIASPVFDKVGVGAAEKNGIVYVTLIFSGPMPHH